MRILVVNAGSSSLKCQIIDTADGSVLMKGAAERVGIPGTSMELKLAPAMEKVKIECEGYTIAQCLKGLLDTMVATEDSPIKSLDEIAAIGNRIVSGGEFFAESVLVDDDVLAKVDWCSLLAPLHNPAAVACIKLMREVLPSTPQSVVFDTAFHQSMPAKAYMYPLPMKYYKEHAVRRYGAHGTSHAYATEKAAELLGKPVSETNVITCHLGNGGSISAVENGKCVDTTMGMTPLEGIMMGTRCGSIDPAIVPFIMREENLSPEEMDRVMNKESGFLGISGVSSDMREVEGAAADGNEDAKLALEMYNYRVIKEIGAYYAVLPRTDAIVFTAGIGENGIGTRADIIAGLEHLGIKLDPELNNNRGKDMIISAADSTVTVMIVAADEEMRIAKETEALL